MTFKQLVKHVTTKLNQFVNYPVIIDLQIFPNRTVGQFTDMEDHIDCSIVIWPNNKETVWLLSTHIYNNEHSIEQFNYKIEELHSTIEETLKTELDWHK